MQDTWKASVAILGARMHYAVPTVLSKTGRLEKFYSDGYLSDDGIGKYIRKILLRTKLPLLHKAALRFEGQLPAAQVHAYPLLGLSYALALRMFSGEHTREKLYEFFGSWFGRSVSRTGFGNAVAVYGMNTASLELFEQAKRLNIHCVLEQCSVPNTMMNTLFLEEYDLWPDWEESMAKQFTDRLALRETDEWELTDIIVAGSSFVIDNLVRLGVPKEKCKLIPYAVNVSEYHPKDALRDGATKGHLKVLFLGGVGLRKGVQYLFTALGKLDELNIETRAAGKILVNIGTARCLSERMELLGLVPRSDVKQLLNWADVLVLPSVCEGSAMVTYEALASGVSVITTPNSGSPVQDGITGFIVPNRDADAIADRLKQLASDPQLRWDMSVQARQYAEQHLSLEAYTMRLISAIESVIV